MMIRVVPFFILCFTILAGNCFAQTSVIHGDAPQLISKRILVYGSEDHISERVLLLDSTTIDEEGHFELEVPVNEFRYVSITADYISAQMYLQTGTTYDIEFPVPDVPRSFGRGAQTEVIFNNLDLDDINALIIDFNYNYEQFFNDNYALLKQLFSPKDRSAQVDTTSSPTRGSGGLKTLMIRLSTFALDMDSIYAAMDNSYFKLYRSSVVADLVMNSSVSQRNVFEEYIEPYTLSNNHPEFTRLHRRFYKFYLTRFAQAHGRDKLDSAININGSYTALKDLLDLDDFAAQAERKDQIILFALKEIWNNPSVKHGNAIAIVDSMISNGASKHSRAMAGSMRSVMTARKKGFPIAPFTFEDQYKDEHSLAEERAKPMLIELWAPWCSNCALEQSQLATLTDEYGKHVDIISIKVTDDDSKPGAYTGTKDALQAQMDFYNPWIKECAILSIPTYILLDSEGRVMRDNCPLPSNGLEAILFSLKAKSTGGRKPRVGRRDN
jgi:thiol-disulfide isomerase/thioredoxin